MATIVPWGNPIYVLWRANIALFYRKSYRTDITKNVDLQKTIFCEDSFTFKLDCMEKVLKVTAQAK